MDTQCVEKMMCKAKECAKNLCSIKVKDNLDFSMSLTDDCEGNFFSKSIKSDSEFSLVKFLAVLMLLGVAMSGICCALYMKNCKK